ncbi:MAG: SGNH/GDSL hydrolase family protein [Jatrophihabitantaceae bacterium]
MFSRYVALGDSQTEGMNDGDETSGYRGFADRLAANLARLNPELQYANLAVRGRLVREIRTEQLGPALAMAPDLVTVVGGMNDLMRPRFDAAVVTEELERMFAELTAAGVRVATVTFPDIGKIAPMVRRLAPRVVELNARIRAAAGRHGVAVLDAEPYPVTTDPRLWSTDRIHATPLGHARIAAGLAHALQLPGADATWADPLPALIRARRLEVVRAEWNWTRAFVLPWLGRRLRGQSSGDGRTAKFPTLAPLSTTA